MFLLNGEQFQVLFFEAYERSVGTVVAGSTFHFVINDMATTAY